MPVCWFLLSTGKLLGKKRLYFSSQNLSNKKKFPGFHGESQHGTVHVGTLALRVPNQKHPGSGSLTKREEEPQAHTLTIKSVWDFMRPLRFQSLISAPLDGGRERAEKLKKQPPEVSFTAQTRWRHYYTSCVSQRKHGEHTRKEVFEYILNMFFYHRLLITGMLVSLAHQRVLYAPW